VDDVESTFVAPFPESLTRAAIFEYWTYHRAALVELITVEKQWLDGSFVTDKADPGDVDLATFYDAATYEALPTHRRLMLDVLLAGAYTKEMWGCDAYSVAIYPEGHQYRNLYEAARDYWTNWFGHDRDGVAKGYLEVSP
jgi:hypothetical protein